ncbi:MAG TPA: thiamine-phosphate kinase, partial [Pyrinomonadaceae bacterium]|nr:thiamine-phosphate kinase [Pyrinomonadaceae bacterium]
MPNELEIISRIRSRARPSRDLVVGIGDDAAVIKTARARDLIVCCDLMVEGVHFRIGWSEPELIGRKALAVTLSDVAAMGGAAKFAMASIALPHHLSPQFIEEIFRGMFDLADSCDISIIGGDTSSSRDSLFIDTIAIGECAEGRAIERRGAEAGNGIYVTGTLGASALGLLLLEQGLRLSEASESAGQAGRLRREALSKQLAPEPRLTAGRLIGEQELATAMIDISDGLSTDLTHILEESRCGAIIHEEAIPVAECVRGLSSELKIDPLSLALHSGEEYELLFTAPP